MASPFIVRTTTHFDRLLHALHKHHKEVAEQYAEAIRILSVDPYNRNKRHHIKKLEGVNRNDGQYRLSLGRWRFRYDVFDREIILQYCGLRREDTYR